MSSKGGTKRDEFSRTTLHELAARSGYLCSFPDCRQMTVGPSDDRKSGVTMLGVGAHITAARANGPRYDKSLSPEERRNVNNGVWMCQSHAKLVDDNNSKHTAAELRRWKTQHEDWVFRRVANGPTNLHAGVSALRINNIGPFRERSELKLGRVTVIVGKNGTGKSTVCESLSAFSGEPLFSQFADRWRFGTAAGNGASIETTVVGAHDVTNVKLIEHLRPFHVVVETDDDEYTSEEDDDWGCITDSKNVVGRHFQIEVNGAISCIWPTSLYPTIVLNGELRGKQDPSFEKAISNLARQFRLPEDVLWNSFTDDFFVSSGYPCRFRLTAARQIQIALPGRDHFLPPEHLSTSEEWRIIIALANRFCLQDRRATPWIMIVDTSVSNRLDSDGKALLMGMLGKDDDNGIQLVICLTFEDDVPIARTLLDEKWLSAKEFGGLTVHTFL